MATIGVTGVYRKELTGTAAAATPYHMIPPGLTRVTLAYKVAVAGTGNAVQKTYSSGDAVQAGTAEWADIAANVTNTTFDGTNKTVLGDETVTAVRVVRSTQDITLAILGVLIPQ